ncbi:MAG TPA: HIT domain-containing protein [Candidatus Nanoarchaeia archaeon]|nr:HIT domain-containing protein [Candidatus Nanoarchaeia archaeon]
MYELGCGLCDAVKEGSRIVYETDHAIGLLNLNPINPTHLLVLPRRHVQEFIDLRENEAFGYLILREQMEARIHTLFPSNEHQRLSPGSFHNANYAQTQEHVHEQVLAHCSHARHSYDQSHEVSPDEELGIKRIGEWKSSRTHPLVEASVLDKIVEHIRGTGNLERDRAALNEANEYILRQRGVLLS